MKSKAETAAQDCADETAAWDREASQLQRLRSQRDESIAKLAKLDQEIHSSVEQVAGLQREYLEALDVLQKEQIDGCNKVESGGSRSKAHRGVAPDEPMQQEDGKRLGSSHTWAEYQTSEPHSRAE